MLKFTRKINMTHVSLHIDDITHMLQFIFKTKYFTHVTVHIIELKILDTRAPEDVNSLAVIGFMRICC